MNRTLLNGKIHRATVTESNLNYIGSITIDEILMKEANIIENEKVSVVNVDNGNRIETYVIKGQANSGVICLNGAAAHLFNVGDKIIIMSYVLICESEIKNHKPNIIFLDNKNQITQKKNIETANTFHN